MFLWGLRKHGGYIISPHTSNTSNTSNKNEKTKKKNYFLDIFFLSIIFLLVVIIILIFRLKQSNNFLLNFGFGNKPSKIITMPDLPIDNYGLIIHDLKLKYKKSQLLIKGYIKINDLNNIPNYQKSYYLKCLFSGSFFENYMIELQFLDKDNFPIVKKMISKNDLVGIVDNNNNIISYYFSVSVPIDYNNFKDILQYNIIYHLNNKCFN